MRQTEVEADVSKLGRRRGTSLVEVLVVIVILFIGILVVVSLFPPGFLTVRRSETLTFAMRLAQYELEWWKNNPDNLPEGVLPINDSGDVLDDLFPGPPVKDDAAMAFRRIVGETTRIPFGGWSTGPESGSIYILSHGPVDLRAGHGIAVRGGNLSRRIMDSSDTDGPPAWQTLRPYQYGIDYGEEGDIPLICFRVSNQPRTFYVTCSWWEQTPNGPEYHTTMNMRIDVAAGEGAWKPLPIPANMTTFLGVDRYSDRVSRGFRQLDIGDAWDPDDAYQFKLIDPVVGILAFNPIGYTQTEFGQYLEARIDYDVLDPQIIHEDRRVDERPSSVPSTDPYVIKLTLNRIKQAGVTTEIDGSQYRGLPPLPNPPALGPDLVAVDLETARQVDPTQIRINYKDGYIQFVPDQNGTVHLLARPDQGGVVSVSPAGRTFRLLYKADGDWAVQLMKAYYVYERRGSAPLDYKSYYIDGSNPRRLWFAACNANQSVSVDYDYVVNGETIKIIGENIKLSDVLLPNPVGVIGSDGRLVKWAYADLKYIPARIYAVNGTSVRARVVWRDGERWRNVDLDTTLIRAKQD